MSITIIGKHFLESSKVILSLQNFEKEIKEIVESILKCDKNKKKFLLLVMVDLVLTPNTLQVNFYVLLTKRIENHFQPYH